MISEEIYTELDRTNSPISTVIWATMTYKNIDFDTICDIVIRRTDENFGDDTECTRD